MQAFHFDTVDSTNDVAKRLIADGRCTESAYVLAREQTAGRGQRGRAWLSPRDAGIYLSVVDRPDVRHVDLSLFTRAAGIACATVLRDVTGLDVRLKPVNDIYVDGGKLGGILTEAIIEQNTLRALITGIGTNTRTATRHAPDATAPPVSIQDLVAPGQFGFLDFAAISVRLAQAVIDWNAVVSRGDSQMLEMHWAQLQLGEFGSDDMCGAGI